MHCSDIGNRFLINPRYRHADFEPISQQQVMKFPNIGNRFRGFLISETDNDILTLSRYGYVLPGYCACRTVVSCTFRIFPQAEKKTPGAETTLNFFRRCNATTHPTPTWIDKLTTCGNTHHS
ncbi:Uncharacterised protein g2771 [Pycnogonum litorale]